MLNGSGDFCVEDESDDLLDLGELDMSHGLPVLDDSILDRLVFADFIFTSLVMAYTLLRFSQTLELP